MIIVGGLPAKLAAMIMMILGGIFCRPTLQIDLAADGLRRNPTPPTEAPMTFQVAEDVIGCHPSATF